MANLTSSSANAMATFEEMAMAEKLDPSKLSTMFNQMLFLTPEYRTRLADDLLSSVSNRISERKKLSTLVIKQILSVEDQIKLRKSFTMFNLDFSSAIDGDAHAFARAHRILGEAYLYNLAAYDVDASPMNGFDVVIKDVGGNPVRNIQLGRKNVHTCFPVLSHDDEIRHTNYYSFLRTYNTLNYESNQYKTFLRHAACCGDVICGSKSQHCDIKAPTLMFIHSTYDMDVIDIATAMTRANAYDAYGCFIFHSDILYNLSGCIEELDVNYQRFVRDGDVFIRFWFSNDVSHGYEHRFSTYISLLKVHRITDICRERYYSVEFLSVKNSVYFFKISRFMSSFVPRSIAYRNLPVDNKDNVIIHYWKWDNSEYRRMVPLRLVVPRKLFNDTYAYAMTLPEGKFLVKNVLIAANAFNTREVMQGQTVSSGARIPPEDVMYMANAVYYFVFIRNYENSKVLSILRDDEENTRKSWSWRQLLSNFLKPKAVPSKTTTSLNADIDNSIVEDFEAQAREKSLFREIFYISKKFKTDYSRGFSYLTAEEDLHAIVGASIDNTMSYTLPDHPLRPYLNSVTIDHFIDNTVPCTDVTTVKVVDGTVFNVEDFDLDYFELANNGDGMCLYDALRDSGATTDKRETIRRTLLKSTHLQHHKQRDDVYNRLTAPAGSREAWGNDAVIALFCAEYNVSIGVVIDDKCRVYGDGPRFYIKYFNSHYVGIRIKLPLDDLTVYDVLDGDDDDERVPISGPVAEFVKSSVKLRHKTINYHYPFHNMNCGYISLYAVKIAEIFQRLSLSNCIMSALDIYGTPGGAVQYLTTVTSAVVYGMAKNDYNDVVKVRTFVEISKECGNADISCLQTIRYLKHYIRMIHPNGIDLVVANPYGNYDEHNFHLCNDDVAFANSVFAASLLLTRGGTLIINTPRLVSNVVAYSVDCLTKLFSYVTVIRPEVSRQLTNDHFFVCRDYIGYSDELRPMLQSLLDGKVFARRCIVTNLLYINDCLLTEYKSQCDDFRLIMSSILSRSPINRWVSNEKLARYTRTLGYFDTITGTEGGFLSRVKKYFAKGSVPDLYDMPYEEIPLTNSNVVCEYERPTIEDNIITRTDDISKLKVVINLLTKSIWKVFVCYFIFRVGNIKRMALLKSFLIVFTPITLIAAMRRCWYRTSWIVAFSTLLLPFRHRSNYAIDLGVILKSDVNSAYGIGYSRPSRTCDRVVKYVGTCQRCLSDTIVDNFDVTNARGFINDAFTFTCLDRLTSIFKVNNYLRCLYLYRMIIRSVRSCSTSNSVVIDYYSRFLSFPYPGVVSMISLRRRIRLGLNVLVTYGLSTLLTKYTFRNALVNVFARINVRFNLSRATRRSLIRLIVFLVFYLVFPKLFGDIIESDNDTTLIRSYVDTKRSDVVKLLSFSPRHVTSVKPTDTEVYDDDKVKSMYEYRQLTSTGYQCEIANHKRILDMIGKYNAKTVILAEPGNYGVIDNEGKFIYTPKSPKPKYQWIFTVDGFVDYSLYFRYTQALVSDYCEKTLDPMLTTILDVIEVPRRLDVDASIVQAAPGCGKTTYIVKNHKFDRDTIVICATIQGKDDIIERIETTRRCKLSDNDRKRYRTAESYLLNEHTKCDNLWIDEALMHHPGKICYIIYLSGAKTVRLLGDTQQIPFVNRTPTFKCSYDKLQNLFPISEVLDVSWRCPVDIAARLYERYYAVNSQYGFQLGMRSANDIRDSVSIKKISSVVNVPLVDNVQYLVFTQSEKQELLNRNYNVSTVHEYQGKQAAVVYVVRLSPYEQDEIYRRGEYALVALTRHSQTMVYYTACTNDALSAFIKNKPDDSMITRSLYTEGGALNGAYIIPIADDYAQLHYTKHRANVEFTKANSVTCAGVSVISSDKKTLWSRLNQVLINAGETKCVFGQSAKKYYSQGVLKRYAQKYIKNVDISVSFGNWGVDNRVHDVLCYNAISQLPNPVPLECFDVSMPDPGRETLGCAYASIQLIIDTCLPGTSFVDTSFDSWMVVNNDLELPMTKFSYNRIKKPVHFTGFDTFRPVISSAVPNLRYNNYRESLLALYKRNMNVPQLYGIVDITELSTRLVDRLISKFLVRTTFEPITLSEYDIDDWLSGQSIRNRDSIVPDCCLEMKQLDRYEFAIKRTPKPNLTTESINTYAALQTIVSHTKDINVIFCPIFREVKNRLLRSLKDNYKILTDCSLDEFRDKMNRDIPTFGYDDVDRLEIDISKYDKSQSNITLEFECRIMAYFGVTERFVELWRNSHMYSRLNDRVTGMSADISYQRKSGDASTFLGNTMFLMAIIADTFYYNDIKFGLFAGDDSLLYGCGLNNARDMLNFNLLYNLECKFLVYYHSYFCSKFFVIHDGRWYILPDPLKLAVKLGRRDLRNEEHLEQYRISFNDNARVYSDFICCQLAADCLKERYKINVDLSCCIAELYNVSKDINEFKNLFYTISTDNLLCDPSLPSLEC